MTTRQALKKLKDYCDEHEYAYKIEYNPYSARFSNYIVTIYKLGKYYRGIHELISVRKSDDKTIVDVINYLIDVEMEE